MNEIPGLPSMRDLEAALAAAGFPANVGKVIGAQFVFRFRAGRQRSILSGTITAIELADKELQLFVSTPSILGGPIMLFRQSGTDWCAQVRVAGDERPHGYYGQLTLLRR